MRGSIAGRGSLDVPQEVILERNVPQNEECRRLIAVYDAYSHLSSQRSYSGEKVLHYLHLQDLPEEQALLSKAGYAVMSALRGLFSFTGLYPEALFIAMLARGGHHPTHADNERYERGRWIPNHTPQRAYSAILYLNSEFEGGELRFEQLGIRIKPVSGLLVGFPSDHSFVHSVDPVIHGSRYSVPIWFTKDKNRSLRLSAGSTA